MTDSTPKTAAGRSLNDECGDQLVAGGTVLEYILAIEAEAAILATQPEPLNVETLADVLTELHIKRDGGCSETHRPDAEFVAIRYLARLSTEEPR